MCVGGLGKLSCTPCDHKVNTTVRGRSVLGVLRDAGVADDRPGWKTTGSLIIALSVISHCV